MRVAFFGSPAFALPVLDALLNHHDVRLVVTQPDKPAGRGLALHAPAAAKRARELGLRLEQPTRLKGNEAFHDLLEELALDVAITAAYGRILPASLLAVPRHGFLNVHASLLPRYRGAAPVQWALINGEAETGVTIMQTEAGLDTGPVRLQRRVSVEASDDAGSLLQRLSVLGAETLLEALSLLGEGTLPLAPQNDAEATLAPPLKPEDGWIRWHDPAERVVSRHKGVSAWPGSSFEHAQQRVKVESMRVQDHIDDAGAAPGTVLQLGADGLQVAAGTGAVLLETVKPAGKRAMAARDWANGRGVRKGQVLG
ncbi:MAG: methionyl-tRNA formyltransferase [Trueperaceae bacterium]